MPAAITGTQTLGNHAAIENAATRAPKNQLGGDDFLKLFVTQLQHQDPSSPMDTNDMLGQVTQLATMESLSNLQSSLSEILGLSMRSSGADLVGNHITWNDANGEERAGKVLSAQYGQGIPVLTTEDGQKITLDAVTSTSETAPAPAAPAEPTA
jgi:flagellar basal-body rod modification protein FlgD